MVLIIYGKRIVRRPLERAPVLCPICRIPTACTLNEVRQVDHLYYITMGKGKFIAYEYRCDDCRTQWRFDELTTPIVNRDVDKRRNLSIDQLLDSAPARTLELLHNGMMQLDMIRNGTADPQIRIGRFAEGMSAADSHVRNNERTSVISILAAVAAVILTVATPLVWYMYFDPISRTPIVYPIALTAAFGLSVVLCIWGIRRSTEMNRRAAVERLARSLRPLNTKHEDYLRICELAAKYRLKYCRPRSPEELDLLVSVAAK